MSFAQNQDAGTPAENTFDALRKLEQASRHKPPIGKSRTTDEAVATLGQEPHLASPGTDLKEVLIGPNGVPDLRIHFLGLFGPNGALPTSTTVQALRWAQDGDRSFVDFADVLTVRFLQLFFRAWSDAQAITQMDSGGHDRFKDYVLSVVGQGTLGMQNRGVIPDEVRQQIAPLSVPRVKSISAFRTSLSHLVHGNIEIEEYVPMKLAFEPQDLSRLGVNACALGASAKLGSLVETVNSRVRVHIKTDTLEEFEAFLPGTSNYAIVADLFRSTFGHSLSGQTVLYLKRAAVPLASLGQTARLGWMASLHRSSDGAQSKIDDETYVAVSNFEIRE